MIMRKIQKWLFSRYHTDLTSVPSQHPGIFYRKQLNHVIKQVKILSNKNAATNHDLIG